MNEKESKSGRVANFFNNLDTAGIVAIVVITSAVTLILSASFVLIRWGLTIGCPA